MKSIVAIILLAFIISSCNAVKETSKYQLETGVYKVRGHKNKPHYTLVDEEKVSLHPALKTKEGWVADATVTLAVYLSKANAQVTSETFIARSFDLDVITILFKYRPGIGGFPKQLNTNFNGAVYLGYRSDLYTLSYERNPLNLYQRRINHFAYSLGFFTGLGATSINPFVTNNTTINEYDGVIISKGVAGMIGIGNLTFGAALGLDHLIDKNHTFWIYQAKPWLGFTVGLNLN
jgi:hypothetical protein